MSETPLPVWDERERPSTHLIDRHTNRRDFCELPEPDRREYRDLLEWINYYKIPLHRDIRAEHPKTAERLEKRDINLEALGGIVADITQRPPYPTQRVATFYDMRTSVAYKEAIEDGLIKRPMKFGEDGIAYSQFDHTFHFLRLRQSFIDRAPRERVIDSIAKVFGHAILAPVTYAHLTRSENGNSFYSWFGYTWRHNNRYYGQVFDDASGAKIGAVVRREMGLVNDRGDPDTPDVNSYNVYRGISYAATGAIALDILNKAAGHSDDLGIYRPVWAFMADLQDDAARAELGSMISRATNNQLSLEDIEAAQFNVKGLSTTFLQRLEEACNIDYSKRPSRMIEAIGVH